jgi:phosphate uptake regulator
MFKELFSIFTGDSPMRKISANFQKMIAIAQEMALEASTIYWETKPSLDRVRALTERDIKVNKLERTIRKQVATHLTLGQTQDVPYCLLMMSLVKDIERIGDYAKNMAEATELSDEPIPDDDLTLELRDIRDKVETLIREAAKVFSSSDRERATELTVEGRTMAKRCDELLKKFAKSQYPSGLSVKLALGARYYKRYTAHLLNLLSGVIMPLHKLDYYDASDLAKAGIEED